MLRTPAARGSFGAASVALLGLAIVGRVDILPMRQGTAPWVDGSRSTGSQGTTRRPNSRKLRWSEWTPQPTPFPGIGDGGEFMVVSPEKRSRD